MKRNGKDYINYIINGIIVFLILYFVIKYWDILKEINVTQIRNFILSYGRYAALCFIVIYSLKPVLFIVPSSILSIIAGNVFGPYMALFLSMIGCFLAGTLAFFIARYFGKPFVDKILKGKVMKLDSSIEKHGFLVMLLMRLSFVFSYDGLSFAGGLTKMNYRDFIAGSLIGILPEMITYSFMGENLYEPFSVKFIIPVILLVIVALVSSFVYKKYKRTRKI